VGAKPKFCSSCGQSLNSFATKVEEVKESTAEVEEIEDEEEISIPDISALDVEIQRFEQPKVTLGQILEANKDKESSEE
tara:strand:- start:1655 stop:1891 length:237 start_codon:yes stop_codon:yes gene_type:complete